MIRRVMLYCRVSTERQAKKGDSITDQLDALHKWADEHNCVIIGEYIDAGSSASKPYTTRPEFCRMLADADRLRPDLLLFTRLDRFTRKPRDYYNLAETFKQHNLEWKAIWQDFDTTTSIGRSLIGFFLVIAEQESENTSERIKMHNVEKRARGELCSGKLPRGYIIQNKRPVKDPECMEGMKAFWDTYLAGFGSSAAIKAAAEHGFIIPSLSSAGHITRNAHNYTGTIQGVPCEPYITPEQAELTLSLRKKKIRYSDYEYLFKGLIICGECGYKYSCEFTRRVIHGVAMRWGDYLCAHHRNKPDLCNNKVCYSERLLEKYLLDNIADLMDAENHRIMMRNEEIKTVDYSRNINRLKKKRERTIELFVDGMIEREEFNRRCVAIDSELSELYKHADAEQAPEPLGPLEPLPEGWKDVYNSLSPKAKHEFWFNSLESIVIFPDRSIVVNFRH